MSKWEKIRKKFDETLQGLSHEQWLEWDKNQSRNAKVREEQLIHKSFCHVQTLILGNGFTPDFQFGQIHFTYFDDNDSKEKFINKKDLANFEVFFINKIMRVYERQ